MGKVQKEILADMKREPIWWTAESVSSWLGMSLSKATALLDSLYRRGLLEEKTDLTSSTGKAYRVGVDLLDFVIEEESGPPLLWKHKRVESHLVGGKKINMYNEAILRLGIKGLPDERIASLMGTSAENVDATLRRYGVRARSKRPSRHKLPRVRVFELVEQGLNDRQIAERLGLSRSAVQKIRSSAGLEPVLSPIDKEAFLSLYNQGMGDAHIAAQLSRTKTEVTRLRRTMGLPTQGRARVQIPEPRLLELHAQGLSDGQIAAELGVSRTHVLKARKRLGLASNRPRGGQRKP